jgi:hypothetical protein
VRFINIAFGQKGSLDHETIKKIKDKCPNFTNDKLTNEEKNTIVLSWMALVKYANIVDQKKCFQEFFAVPRVSYYPLYFLKV